MTAIMGMIAIMVLIARYNSYDNNSYHRQIFLKISVFKLNDFNTYDHNDRFNSHDKYYNHNGYNSHNCHIMHNDYNNHNGQVQRLQY